MWSIYEVNVSVQESMFYNNKVNLTLILTGIPIEKPTSASLLAAVPLYTKVLRDWLTSVLVLRNWSLF